MAQSDLRKSGHYWQRRAMELRSDLTTLEHKWRQLQRDCEESNLEEAQQAASIPKIYADELSVLLSAQEGWSCCDEAQGASSTQARVTKANTKEPTSDL